MQFNFNINEVLKDSIEVIDHNSKLDYYNSYIDLKCVENLRIPQKLSYIIDSMGHASKLAQNLPKVITTSSKLKTSDQRVYLSKEELTNNGNGEVIGLLKVGYKKLFVYDIQGNQHETKPLCVLDFYVHESKQRQGFGKSLFEFMLKRENIEPQNLAIDRPSAKFVSFLAKHYHLTDPLPQANNFVIFTNFFTTANSRDSANYARQRRYNYPVLSPMAVAGLTKQLPPPIIPEPVKPITLTSTSRSRPITSNIKDHVNLDFEKIPMKTGPTYPEPPMLRRDGVSHYKWYLHSSPYAHNSNTISSATANHKTLQNNCNIHNNDAHFDSVLPKINTNNHNNKLSEASLYNGYSATKSTPSLTSCDTKQQTKMHTHGRNDYNYSVGLARNYSHNQIW